MSDEREPIHDRALNAMAPAYLDCSPYLTALNPDGEHAEHAYHCPGHPNYEDYRKKMEAIYGEEVRRLPAIH